MSRHLALAVLVAFASPWIVGCDGCDCGGPDPIAELEVKKGDVQRDQESHQGQWREAEVGSPFEVGDGARTGPGASARFRLRDDGVLRLEERTQIRFRASPPGETGGGVEVMAGDALIEAPANGKLRMQTQFGLAVLDEGSGIRLAAGESGTSFEVMMGEAHLDQDGERRALQSGESLYIDMQGAIVEPKAAAASVDRDGGVEPSDGGPPGDAATDAASGENGSVEAEVRGRAVRVKSPDDKRWRVLRPGAADIDPGTEMRVARRGKVRLTRGDEQARLRGPGRFVIGDGAALVRDEAGEVSAEAGAADVTVRVPGGHIIVRGDQGSGSAGEVRVTGRGTAVKASRGRVDVRTKDQNLTLRAGETASLGEEEIEVEGRGPDRVHFTVPAGEKFAIRAPDLPVAVGFTFGDSCPEEGMVELRRGNRLRASDRGERQGNLLIPRGAWSYRVRCIQDGQPARRPVASGRIRAVRDKGTARLPPTASRNMVDLDGRKYTLMYQNLLPSVRVRWRRAPSEGRHLLVVDSRPGGTKRIKLGSPSHLFETGDLREGRHVMQMIGPGGRRSPETTVLVRFDNAAATASVRSPTDRSFAPGQTVEVSGVALQGWRVAARGQRLKLDGANRFTGEVRVPANQDGIAIRLSHPGKGIQYYVRRSGEP